MQDNNNTHIKEEKVVVLVGPTGHGKSALGSFLYDPVKYENDPVFARARNNKPQTQEVCTATKEENGTRYCFIDTPGLNEGQEQDLRHMIDVLRVVRDKGNVAAVIICYKLDSKIDDPFKTTIKFYTGMFHSCLDRNLFVVVTNVDMSQKAIHRRKKDKIDIQENCKNIAQEIRAIANLQYDPIILTIDSFPLYDPTEPEYKFALGNREVILDTISKMPIVPVFDMKFHKTPYMQEEDNKRITELKGQIKGYLVALRQESNIPNNILETLQLLSEQLFCRESKIQQISSDLDEIVSSNHLQQVATVHIHKDWTFSWNIGDYKVVSPYPIKDVVKTSPDKVFWRNERRTTHEVSGELVSLAWFKGIQATVSVYSDKKDIYNKQVEELQNCKTKLQAEIKQQEAKLNEFVTSPECAGFQKEIRNLLSFMKEKVFKIEELRQISLPAGKAIEHFGHFNSTSSTNMAAVPIITSIVPNTGSPFQTVVANGTDLDEIVFIKIGDAVAIHQPLGSTQVSITVPTLSVGKYLVRPYRKLPGMPEEVVASNIQNDLTSKVYFTIT